MRDSTGIILANVFKYTHGINYSETLKMYDVVFKDPKDVGTLVDKGAMLQNKGLYRFAVHTHGSFPYYLATPTCY